jgi:hypothetical protein
MKILAFLFVILVGLSCESSQKQNQSNLDTIEDEGGGEKELALKFINAYINYVNDYDASLNLIDWVNQQTILSNSFKSELRRILEEAEKEDPEMGLGFDPILDAQDYPEKGFVVDNVDGEFVILKGIGWEDFFLTLKMVKGENNQWLVDGSGIVNIPEDRIGH